MYLFALIFLLLGKVRGLFLFMGILFIHECGHFLTATILGWKTDKICLYPYGGVSKFQTFVNVSLKEEFFVLIMGPISQVVFVCLLSLVLPDRDVILLRQYNIFLLCFNLLPIYPLDGGRLLALFLELFFPFQKSFLLTVLVSFLFLIFLMCYFIVDFSLLFLLVFILFGHKLWDEYRNFPYVFEKFLLERKMYHFRFPKSCIIEEVSQMKKDTYHFFKKGDTYLQEDVYFREMSPVFK